MIISIIVFFEKEDFFLDHPLEDRIIKNQEVEQFLYQSYAKRQALVDRVQKIVLEE